MSKCCAKFGQDVFFSLRIPNFHYIWLLRNLLNAIEKHPSNIIIFYFRNVLSSYSVKMPLFSERCSSFGISHFGIFFWIIYNSTEMDKTHASLSTFLKNVQKILCEIDVLTASKYQVMNCFLIWGRYFLQFVNWYRSNVILVLMLWYVNQFIK